MNSSQRQNLVVPPLTLKRIYKDLDEINRNPLFGASICMPNQNDPLTLHANLYILDGPYKDLLIHLIVHIPTDYPITGPAANIAPGLKFGHKYHEHLYDDLENGNQICSDLLTNFRGMYDGSKLQKSGWTPAYTLSAVLLQMQVFFADPDLPKHLLPTTEEVEALRKHVRGFTKVIELTDGQTVTHSFDSPYPAIPSQNSSKKETNEKVSKKADTAEKEARKNAEEWLHCAISKCNYFDDSKPILGYPLDIRQDQFGRYWPTAVIEMISYDAYILKVLTDPYKLENYEHVRFKSSFGELYNFWIPVYITEDHWKRSYQHTLNAISVVRKGFRGVAENDFKPQMVLEVLPVILNKMLVQILQGKLHQSMAAIQAYCHFYRLLIRLLVEFPELQQKIDNSVDLMLKSEENRNKTNLGDMGEFLIKLAISKYGIQNESINEVLIEEFLARQVLWVLKENPKIIQQNSNPAAFLKSYLNSVKVSLQLFVVAVETMKLVMNDTAISQTDSQFGVLPKNTMEAYLKKLSWIRETVGVNGNWQVFVQSFKVDRIVRCDEDMAKMIQKAFDISSRQGYTYNTSSSQFAKKKYDDIPYNPNFDFARATYSRPRASFREEPPKPKKNIAMMSTATWADLKVELKGFEYDPIIVGSVPQSKNAGWNKKETGKIAEISTSKYREETKENPKSTASVSTKTVGKWIPNPKAYSPVNSTAENSFTQDSAASKSNKTYRNKYYQNNSKGGKNFPDDKSTYLSKKDKKDDTKSVSSKDSGEAKPKPSVINNVSAKGTLSVSTWGEAGGLLKRIPPKPTKVA